MDGWAILDLSLILFIKPKLHCGRFTLLCNSEILLSQIIEFCVLRTQLISKPSAPPCFKLLTNYRTTLVPLPEKVAHSKALAYDRTFAR